MPVLSLQISARLAIVAGRLGEDPMPAHIEGLFRERCPPGRFGTAGRDKDDRFHLGHEMKTLPGIPPRDWTVDLFAGAVEPAPIPTGEPRFVRMAMMSERQRGTGGELLGTLLGSACFAQTRDCEALRPLWAEEVMQRAYNFVRLVDARDRRDGPANEPTMNPGVAEALARDLVAQFRELDVRRDREVVHCSEVLRNVVTGLGSLFGSPNIAPEVRTDRLLLPAYKRRALVLAATELVTNALLHAFKGRRAGRIAVSLAGDGSNTAFLRVADDGTGFIDARPNLRCGVAAGLAQLLETDLAYERLNGWTIAEIKFPLRRLRPSA